MIIHFRNVETINLTGEALEWALAKALCPTSLSMAINPHSGLSFWSEAWLGNLQANRLLIAGQLQEHHRIDVYSWRAMSKDDQCEAGAQWSASYREGDAHQSWTYAYAPTPTEAIFKLMVTLKLGDKVEIPEVMLGAYQSNLTETNGDDCRESGVGQTKNGSAV